MSGTDALHVALATDRGYLPFAATTVLSCLRTAARPVTVHLLHAGDVGAADLARLGAMVAGHGAVLHAVPVDGLELGPLPAAVAAHGGAVSCARLVLPDLLPDLDRIVYLDADTLVLRPLDELWDLDLDGAAVGAVRNVVEPAMRERLTRLGVVDPTRYLNSGVLVMDLATMRALGTGADLLRCVHDRGDELLWVDQDALNLVLADRWAELHPRWNAQNSFWEWPGWAGEVLGDDRLAEATREPAVLHFEGPWLCKPWHFLCQHPFVDQYRSCLRATPWGDTPLTDRTAVTRVVRRLPRARRTAAYVKVVRLRRRTAAWRALSRRAAGGPTAS